MAIATLRKLGNSAVIAIPSDFLESIKCKIGDDIEITLDGDAISICRARKTLSLADRLKMYEAAIPSRNKEDVSEFSSWDTAPAAEKELL